MTKKNCFISIFAILIAGALWGEEARVGSRVSDFSVTDLTGTPVAFRTLKGNLSVVAFIATRCPISNAYNDRMNALYKDYAPKGVRFIFLNSNSNEPPAEVEQHARSAGFAFPVYKDPNNVVADRFGAMATPEMFVIDHSGTIRYHGYIDDSKDLENVKKQGLRPALDALLDGKPVAIPETKAFGCTITRVRAGQAGNRLAPVDEAGYRKLVQEAKGKVLLVDFWASWCAPCRLEMPELVKLNNNLRARGFQLTLVSIDDVAQAAEALNVLKRNEAPAPFFRKEAKDDEAFIDAVDAKWGGALPGLFLYDKAGNKVRSFIGETDTRTLAAAIEKLL